MPNQPSTTPSAPHAPDLSDVLLNHCDLGKQAADHTVVDILQAIRIHLNMEVAFISEFVGDKRVLRFVESDLAKNPLQVGQGKPLDETFCQYIVDGRLPELMPDVQNNPQAVQLLSNLPLTIGAHIGIPIRLADGSLYGTFCCFSRYADPTLNQRDLSLLRVFAELAGKVIGRERQRKVESYRLHERVRRILKNGHLSSVYQPLFDLSSKQIVGFESVARFAYQPLQAPDMWFKDALECGLGVELESRAIMMALRALPYLKPPLYLSINASPQMIMAGSLEKLLDGIGNLSRLALEITEHAIVHQYQEIARLLQPFRARGLKVAIDDAGAGYASFRHILNLTPDYIKLDISLMRGIDSDPARRALAAAFIQFSNETGSELIAEGIETSAELNTLMELGINKAQGFLLGKPIQLGELSALELAKTQATVQHAQWRRP